MLRLSSNIINIHDEKGGANDLLYEGELVLMQTIWIPFSQPSGYTRHGYLRSTLLHIELWYDPT